MASSSIPKTMRGILIEKTGGTEVLEYRTDLPVPEPKEGEILVKNEFIGINYIDTYYRTGLYPAPKPEILGREASGTILSTGPHNTTSLTAGDRVVWMHTGGYAEYTACPAAKAIKIPSAISSADACAAILQGLTAVTLVEEAHKVLKGDTVLVHAAAGGVGLWLCQVLRAKGAKVIGTASTEAKREEAKSNGASVCCGYEREEVLALVKKETGGEGVRAVFDGVGKSTWDLSLEAVARKGSVISFGNASGAVEPFAISRLSAKNAKIARPTLFNYLFTREEFEGYANELFKMMIEDKFNVKIHEVYPVQDVARAHNDLEGRKTTGKLLLKP
ncbi:NADPH:quinone reductase [Xylographa carneopallida]|nr:NADPH:quinone reductase [Xylographa carneopallida]